MRFRSPCKLIHDQPQIGVNDTSPSAVSSSVRHCRNLQRVRLTHVSHCVACRATAAAAGREGCAMGLRLCFPRGGGLSKPIHLFLQSFTATSIASGALEAISAGFNVYVLIGFVVGWTLSFVGDDILGKD